VGSHLGSSAPRRGGYLLTASASVYTRVSDEELANMVRAREVRPRKVAVSVRLDPRVLDWLKNKGEGHLTRINDILANVMDAEERTRRGARSRTQDR
jgi:uncharacterized protein (DUF4415 family)